MPSGDDGKHVEETYTRLSIAMCEHDQGTRGPEFDCDCPGYRCEAIEVLPGMDLNAGQQATINVTIRNLGTMDATGVIMESAYTIFIGNETESFVPISTQTVPLVASGGHQVAIFHWTPPDTPATHGCIHARVFDTYSMIHASDLAASYGINIFSWRSRENPQAGWKNVRLIPITQRNKSLVLTYVAKNFSPRQNLATRTLITPVNNRTRLREIDEEHPLPYAVDRALLRRVGVPAATAAVRRTDLRTASGRRLPPVSAGGMWPRADVNPRFVHKRFGFIDASAITLPSRIKKDKLGHFQPDVAAIDMRKVSSLLERKLKPREEMILPVVIPPSEFPEQGARKVFRIDYQKGTEEPVVHFVYLYG